MGVLGGLMGLGNGMSKVGEEGMQATLQQQRDDALSDREDKRIKAANDRQDAHDAAAAKAQAAHDAAEEERQKRIYEWKSEADLNKISDPRYVADKDAEAKRKRDSDAELEKLKHQNKLSEIDAEAAAKAKSSADKKDKDMFGKVELKNGQVVSESDLRGDYTTRWGKFDPMGNLIGMEDGAPTYDAYRNSQVSPEYQRSFSNSPSSPTAMDKTKARAQATKEADARDPIGPDFLRPGATQEAYGSGGRDAWIDNRTNEILNGSSGTGLLNTPQAPSAAAPAPAAPAMTLTTPATPAGPKVGDVIDGYRFKGGNPNDASSWGIAK